MSTGDTQGISLAATLADGDRIVLEIHPPAAATRRGPSVPVLFLEGRTEKLAFPFIFPALGHDVDREVITIVDCGGKPKLRRVVERVVELARSDRAVVEDPG